MVFKGVTQTPTLHSPPALRGLLDRQAPQSFLFAETEKSVGVAWPVVPFEPSAYSLKAGVFGHEDWRQLRLMWTILPFSAHAFSSVWSAATSGHPSQQPRRALNYYSSRPYCCKYLKRPRPHWYKSRHTTRRPIVVASQGIIDRRYREIHLISRPRSMIGLCRVSPQHFLTNKNTPCLIIQGLERAMSPLRAL